MSICFSLLYSSKYFEWKKEHLPIRNPIEINLHKRCYVKLTNLFAPKILTKDPILTLGLTSKERGQMSISPVSSPTCKYELNKIFITIYYLQQIFPSPPINFLNFFDSGNNYNRTILILFLQTVYLMNCI